MKLLAVGGPRHGEQLPYKEGQTYLNIAVITGARVEWRTSETYPTISVARYERRVVSDRVVWVYVGA